MRGIITITMCERCKRAKKHGEWFFPDQESLTLMREGYANGEIDFDFVVCDHCRPN